MAMEGAGSPTASQNSVHVLHYRFNQDQSCFFCGTTSGFRSFVVPERADSQLKEAQRVEGAESFLPCSVPCIDMSFRSNVFAMVRAGNEDYFGGDSCKVRLYVANNQALSNNFFRSRQPVKNIVLSLSTIAVVCHTTVAIYSSDDLRILRHLETAPNPKGLCAMAATGRDSWLLCCPGDTIKAVRVQCADETATHVFNAHKTGVAAIALNIAGTLLATASDFGTVVKVFSPLDAQLLYNLRRSSPGIKKEIVCIRFSPDDKFLAVSSSSPKVHVFKFPALVPSTSGTEVGSYASFRIPGADGGDVRRHPSSIRGAEVAFHPHLPRIYILHYNGIFYECSFDPNRDALSGGQECSIEATTVWFAVRPDFQVHTSATALQTVRGGQDSDDEDAEEWTLLQ
mmetsp:Transcript_26194/g.57741  ORF Transcript_26194/g.57741 Transcript_26194/m.57741 type:complete len:398 (-) Transcript_26194:87-1280(-)